MSASLTTDPSSSPYWKFFTPSEQQNILNHPLQDTAIEIDLLRSLLAAFLSVSLAHPITDPELSLQALYSVSLTAAVIASLVRDALQADLFDGDWEHALSDAYHRTRTFLGIYTFAIHLGLGSYVGKNNLAESTTFPDFPPPLLAGSEASRPHSAG